MKRALIDPNGLVTDFADGNEFPVAPPFFWADVPDDTILHATRWSEAAGFETPPEAIAQTLTQALLLDPVDGKTVTMYTMRIGGGLPEHLHHDVGHDMRVINGAVKVLRNGGEETYTAGQRTEFPPEQLHAIEALEDGTVIINTQL